MGNNVKATLTVALLALSGGPLLAADGADPDWPCNQRKIEHLSIGALWPTPIPESGASLPDDLRDLAARLALRRVTEDEAKAMIAQTAAAHPDLGPDGYARIFQAVFDHIDGQRARIVEGIGRYARNQSQLATEIDRLNDEMAQLSAAETPDYDRMDEVESETDWRVRIFNDRKRALSYVCESPVLLEQRAFAIARMLLAEAG